MTTYSELQTQIRDYTETDSTVLTDIIVDDFLNMLRKEYLEKLI